MLNGHTVDIVSKWTYKSTFIISFIQTLPQLSFRIINILINFIFFNISRFYFILTHNYKNDFNFYSTTSFKQHRRKNPTYINTFKQFNHVTNVYLNRLTKLKQTTIFLKLPSIYTYKSSNISSNFYFCQHTNT